MVRPFRARIGILSGALDRSAFFAKEPGARKSMRQMFWKKGPVLGRGCFALLAAGVIAITGAAAQQPSVSTFKPLPMPREGPAAGLPANDPLVVPGFWDPRRRPERPDLSRITIIRFLTETDYPPFDYAGPDGNPAGFNVDLARLICEEIKTSCTVQMRRFDTLIPSLENNSGDAVIASIAPTPELRGSIDFTDPYYRTPARFVSRRDVQINDVRPQALEGKKIAVIAGTAHEAYLKTLFTEAEVHPYANADAARAALQRGEVDLLFGDGIALAFWLNGTSSGGCCVFLGGPFLESRYFGEGIGIAVRHGNNTLRQALNWALFQLWEKGRFTDLWLRYFPISPF
ncbi:MAG: transporter substrate-binding domain-containing protein [Acidobacteriota bacterium]